jgi:hypothetical protein
MSDLLINWDVDSDSESDTEKVLQLVPVERPSRKIKKISQNVPTQLKMT